jgi:hypothetical protein
MATRPQKFTSDLATTEQHQWDQWLPLAEWWYNTTYHTTTHMTQFLPLVEWWYNTTYHTATRMTPFEAVYGKKPPSVLSYLPGTLKVQAVDQTLTI